MRMRFWSFRSAGPARSSQGGLGSAPLDERSAAVDCDEIRLAEALTGDDHRIVVFEHGHVRDHRVADDERCRALR